MIARPRREATYKRLYADVGRSHVCTEIKAHANITITKDDAMRRLMFASMLMYKIDEAIDYSKIQER